MSRQVGAQKLIGDLQGSFAARALAATTEDAGSASRLFYQITFAPIWMCRDPPDPTTGFDAATSGVVLSCPMCREVRLPVGDAKLA